MTETILFNFLLRLFSLVHVPSPNIEEARFTTCTATIHQVVIKTLWLHFWEAA